MEIENIIQAAGEEMLNASQDNTMEAFIAEESETGMPTPVSPPADLWQERQRALRAQPVRPIRGAKPRMKLDLRLLLEGPIQEAYKKAIDDSELLQQEGEIERARLIQQQYMQDYFYPTVDALIRLNSQEELLASQEALETLDALVMVPGGGATDGYTSVFITNLYAPAGNIVKSDAQVREALRRIKALSSNGQVRQAGAVATRIQESIDAGNNLATPEDYELIQKVVIRTQ